MDVLNKFKTFIKENNLVKTGEGIILAVSGGPDSLAMLDLFVRIQHDFKLNLIVFHLNHMFREEAFKEARFVSEKAQNYGLSCIVKKYDVPAYIIKKGLSPEEAARNIRFKFLIEEAKSLTIKKAAFAHNKNDYTETVFLNLIRGSALNGLTGISKITKLESISIIHPLLNITRKEIEEYCKKRGLDPCQDPSNLSDDYTRNKIRHHVIPYIEENINFALKDVIFRSGELLKEENDYLNNYASNKYKEILISENNKRIILSLNSFKKLDKVIKKRIIKKTISQIQGDSRDLYAVHYQEILDLVNKSDTGKFLELKGKTVVKISYDRIIFEIGDRTQKKDKFEFQLNVPGEIKLLHNIKVNKKEYNILEAQKMDITKFKWQKEAVKKTTCICDFGKIKLPLKVRNRRKGDVFYPFGMEGKKKIKDFLIDEKIPLELRDKIPVILDDSGKIVWIAGFRNDNRFKVESKSKKLLKLILK